MKKTLKVVLIVLSVLLVLCIALGLWQWKNISAFIDGMRYSQEDISNLITDNNKIIEEALSEYPDVSIRDIDEEEIKAFEEGEITEEDLVEIALGHTSLEEVREKKNEEKKPDNQKETPTPAPSGQSSSQTSSEDAQVAALVAKMYVLKSTYTGRLDALVNEAIAEYKALPKEKRTASAKQSIMSAKIGRAAGLESECNSQVEAVLAELTTVLQKQGKDLSLVNSIRNAYANEKQLKKSYYISKYMN